MTTHDEQKELLALAALDALNEAERRTLDAHLAFCAECRSELRSLSDTAAALTLAGDPVVPSPELRARLLAAVRITPQEGAMDNAEARPSSDGRDASARRAAEIVSLEEARRARGRTVVFNRTAFISGAVAASLLVAALAVAAAVLWQRNGEMRVQMASLSSALERARAELGQTRGELARTRAAVDLFAAPEARTTALAGTEMAEKARARLTYDERTGEAMFTASNLPPAPAGKVYQLWFIAGGKPLPGSVFTTDPRGRAEMHATIPPEGRRAEVFAVTLEPAGGAPAPTGQMYLKGKTEG